MEESDSIVSSSEGSPPRRRSGGRTRQSSPAKYELPVQNGRWYDRHNDGRPGNGSDLWDIAMEGTRTPTFGTLLRSFRRDANLTQEELAEHARVSVRTISDLERGISQAPYRATIEQLADALHLSAENYQMLQTAAQRRRRLMAEAAPVPPFGNLPAEANALIGRERDEAEAIDILRRQDVRLLTLTGVGGVGKTRLALRLASTTAHEFRHGAAFVHLAGVRDPILVASIIAATLGVREEGTVPVRDLLIRQCAAREMLLVLDNFEQVVDAALLISDLQTNCRELTILVTSRVPLHIEGEYEMAVPPLAVRTEHGHAAYSSTLDDHSTRSPADVLFLQRALAVKPDLKVDHDDLVAIAEICRRLDGIPLAIELAAARTKVLAPRALLARLDRRLPLLTGGTRDRPARQQTMRNTIAWSYELLTEGEQQLFRSLAVFMGGCDVTTAEAVVQQTDLLDPLSSLVHQSLLTTVGDERFSMLETIREYGVEQLEERGDAADLRNRHAAYCLRLAREAEPELVGVNEDVWLHRLEVEHDNLRSALQWALDGGDTLDGLRTAGALWRFWYARGHFLEGKQWLAGLLKRAGDRAPDDVRAVALYASGAMAFAQSDLRSAIALWTDALPFFRRRNDSFWIATVLNGLGAAWTDAGNYGHATELLEESLTIRRNLGDIFPLAATLNNLANLARYLGEYGRAERWYGESLTLYDEVGVRGARASTVNNLSLVALELGDINRAERLALESLKLYEESESLEQRIGCRVNLADIAVERMQYDRAQSIYNEALQDYLEVGDPGSAGGAALGLGNLALIRRDFDAALAWADEADRLYGPTERRGHLHSALVRGDAVLARGDTAQAWSVHTAVLKESHERGMALTRAEALDRCGWVRAHEEKWEQAALLCAAAQRLLDDTGASWTRSERDRREAWLERSRQHLGTETFAGIWQRGEEQSQELLASVLADSAVST